MERRVRGNSHARCGVGENPEMISKDYLSLFQGAFSSNKGEDFKAVLDEICRVKDSEADTPRPKKWPNAGCIMADDYSIAWRVFDAQYWGVPQRRKRIYLVADFAGGCAGKILFESEGLSGYTPQGFRSWQGTADPSSEGSGEAGTVCLNDQGGDRMDVSEDVTGTLRAQDHGHPPVVMGAAGFCTEHSAKSRSIGYEEETSPTLRAGTVPAAVYENHSQDTRYTGPIDVAPTVMSTYGTGGNNQPFVVETPKTLKIRCGCEGGGKGALIQDNKSATLGCNNDQTLFQPKDAQGFDRYNCSVKGDVAHTLDTGAGDTVPMVYHPSYGIGKPAFTSGEKANFNFAVNEEVAPTMQASGPDAVAKPEIKAFGVCSKSSHAMLSDNPRSGFYEAKTSRTLDQSGGNAVSSNQGGICVVAPVPETYDVRFTSEGTKNARGHCYKTDISRCLDTGGENPESNHGGVAIVEKEPVAFTQNQRNEVRDLGEQAGALSAQPGMKQQTHVVSTNSNGIEFFTPSVTTECALTLKYGTGDHYAAVCVEMKGEP